MAFAITSNQQQLLQESVLAHFIKARRDERGLTGPICSQEHSDGEGPQKPSNLPHNQMSFQGLFLSLADCNLSLLSFSSTLLQKPSQGRCSRHVVAAFDLFLDCGQAVCTYGWIARFEGRLVSRKLG